MKNNEYDPLSERVEKAEKHLDKVETNLDRVAKELSTLRESLGVFTASIQATLMHINEHYDRADREMAVASSAIEKLSNRVTDIEKENIATKAGEAASRRMIMFIAGGTGAFLMLLVGKLLDLAHHLLIKG